jgi:hypothetical protein
MPNVDRERVTVFAVTAHTTSDGTRSKEGAISGD